MKSLILWIFLFNVWFARGQAGKDTIPDENRNGIFGNVPELTGEHFKLTGNRTARGLAFTLRAKTGVFFHVRQPDGHFGFVGMDDMVHAIVLNPFLADRIGALPDGEHISGNIPEPVPFTNVRLSPCLSLGLVLGVHLARHWTGEFEFAFQKPVYSADFSMMGRREDGLKIAYPGKAETRMEIVTAGINGMRHFSFEGLHPFLGLGISVFLMSDEQVNVQLLDVPVIIPGNRENRSGVTGNLNFGCRIPISRSVSFVPEVSTRHRFTGKNLSLLNGSLLGAGFQVRTGH